VITADLDAELATALSALAGAGVLPAGAEEFSPGGTWRPAPGGNPASYASSVPFEIARLARRPPADVAEALAGALGQVPWIQAANPSGDGYLSVTVTPAALAAVPGRIVAAGPGCARSTILRGVTTAVAPWPDLARYATWPHAWQAQADAMIGRLAEAAGATVSFFTDGERAGAAPRPSARDSPVRAAVAYLGVSTVRYRLARVPPDRAGRLATDMFGRGRGADPLYEVQVAHADAASTLRWAADLGLRQVAAQTTLADCGRPETLLATAAERELLGLLSWLPVRVASAARRRRPDELPRYLEEVAPAWQRCRQGAPALPFGGDAAPADPEMAAARLELADATREILAAGLALSGITAADSL
jgi:arginyl-tRNA synthetase